MPASHWHLYRPPIPVDHEMPYVKDGVLEHDNVARAFPNDPYEQLLVRIMIGAAHDNRQEELKWAGINAAYIERWASRWWATEVRRVWWWFIKLFVFRRSYVVARVRLAFDRLSKRGLLDEQMEWDLLEEGEYYGVTANMKMPVCYPTPALIHELNAALPNNETV